MSSGEENGDCREERPRVAGKSPGDSAIEAFSLFKNYLDVQLRDFKQELSSFKTKAKTPVKLKKESNRIQFEFNSDIQEGLESLMVDSLPDTIRTRISSLISKLKHRNKLIQVADNSPGGWLTVNEYEKPKLGSDSDDEKQLRQAEARAVKKLKTSKPSASYHPYKRFSSFPSDATGDNRQLKVDTTWGAPAQFQPFRAPRTSSSRDVCFSCGQRGHFRADCKATEHVPRRVGYYYDKAASATSAPTTKPADK